MISLADFKLVVERLRTMGYADEDIAWAENITPPTSVDDFAREIIFVICNSGMRFTVAQQIYGRCCDALADGRLVLEVFRHPGKAAAIQRIWAEREDFFAAYASAEDKLAFIAALPWIGGITKYHVAKNFGLDVVKPDVHLARLAAVHGVTPDELCGAVARDTGYRIATVDTLIWRACATGVIDSRTGEVDISAGEERPAHVW